MGRVARYKKIKAVDPFSKTGGKVDLDKDRNDPVRKGIDDTVSRTFLRRTAQIRGQLGINSGYDAPKTRKRPRQGKGNAEKGGEQGNAERNKRKVAGELQRIPGESVRDYRARLQYAKHMDIVNSHRDEHTLSSRRKAFLNERKKLRKLVGKKGRKGKKAQVLRELSEQEDGRAGAGALSSGKDAEDSDEEFLRRARKRRAGGGRGAVDGGEAADGDGEEGAGAAAAADAASGDEEELAAAQERDRMDLMARRAGLVKRAAPRRAATGLRTDVAHRPPTFSESQLRRIAKNRDVTMRTAGERAERDILAHKRALLRGAAGGDAVGAEDSGVAKARAAATEAYAAMRKRRMQRDTLERELRGLSDAKRPAE